MRIRASDYHGGHRPPSDGPPLHDLLAPYPDDGGKMYPDDVYTSPQHYTFGEHAATSIRVIEQVRGRPDAVVTIYRTLPPNVEPMFNTGDWVAIAEGYARMHGMDRGWEEWVEHPVSDEYPMGGAWESREGDWPVLSAQVPVHTVRNGGNDLIEWGYWGPPVRGVVLPPRLAKAGSRQRIEPVYHFTTFGRAGLTYDDWLFVGTRQAALERTREFVDHREAYEELAGQDWTLFTLAIEGTVGPIVTDEQAGYIRGGDEPDDDYDIFPHENTYEDVGSTSYLVRKEAVRLLAEEKLTPWRRAARKTAMPTSWRPFAATPLNEWDAVIVPQRSGRRARYEVNTYGVSFGHFDRLVDAQAALERIYGPLGWEQVSLPKVEVEHYYFGETTEFTDPTHVWVAKLPKLGKRARSDGSDGLSAEAMPFRPGPEPKVDLAAAREEAEWRSVGGYGVEYALWGPSVQVSDEYARELMIRHLGDRDVFVAASSLPDHVGAQGRWMYLPEHGGSFPVIVRNTMYSLTLHILLHELAHIVVDRDGIKGHGHRWRQEYVSLVAQHASPLIADLLRERFEEAGLSATKVEARSGGDRRGNSTDRRNRKVWMLGEFGDGFYVSCTYCPRVLTFETVEADRIDPLGPYARWNVTPACRRCNAQRGNDTGWELDWSDEELQPLLVAKQGQVVLGSQARPTEQMYETQGRVRPHVQTLSKAEAQALTRRILTDHSFPGGDEAVIIDHPSGVGKSSVAWVFDMGWIPAVALAGDMHDELTVIHECAHILRNGPEYAGRQGNSQIAHDDEWFSAFHKLVKTYATSKMRWHFEYEFGLEFSGPMRGVAKQASSGTLYHLTESPHFALDSGHVPEDNAISIRQREAPGLFLTDDPERWVNGHGYLRPYLAEIDVPADVLVDERWGGEKFLPAEHFDRARIVRVIPIDAWVREEYGAPGWIESGVGTTFDTDEPIEEPGWNAPVSAHYPFRGYRYSGPDVRTMSASEHARHERRWREAMQHRGSREASSERQVRQALEGLDLPACAVDGDCIPYSGAVRGRLRERGIEGDIAFVEGRGEFLDQDVLIFVHQVVRVGDLIVDATATQYDASLPSLIVTSVPDYERMLSEATGASVKVADYKLFAKQGSVPGMSVIVRPYSEFVGGVVNGYEGDDTFNDFTAPAWIAVAEVDGRKIGTLVVAHEQSRGLDNVIVSVNVEPRYRRQGVATAMLDAMYAEVGYVHHSDDLTDAGAAWMRAVGLAAPRTAGGDPDWCPYCHHPAEGHYILAKGRYWEPKGCRECSCEADPWGDAHILDRQPERAASAAHFGSKDRAQASQSYTTIVDNGVRRSGTLATMVGQPWWATAPRLHTVPASPRLASVRARTYFHGTDAELVPGDRIVPGGEVGRANHPLSDPGQVHLTPYPGIALTFAEDFSRGGHGRVYEVEPEGALVERGSFPDEPSAEWRAPAARVVREWGGQEIAAWEERYEAAEDVRQFWATARPRPLRVRTGAGVPGHGRLVGTFKEWDLYHLREDGYDTIFAWLPGWGSVHGRLTWESEGGEIEEVWVKDVERRQGLATAMLVEARKINPEVHHSGELTDSGRGWARAVGVRTGGYADPYTIRYERATSADYSPSHRGSIADAFRVEPSELGEFAAHHYVAERDNGRVVGWLHAIERDDRAVIYDLKVHDVFRREGVATALYERAKADLPHLEHSSVLSSDAEAWIDSLGARTGAADPNVIVARETPSEVVFEIDLGEPRRPYARASLWPPPLGWAVTDIEVPPKHQGEGHGRALLHRMLRWADEHGHDLVLGAASTGPMTQEELEAWYERNGFAWDDDGIQRRRARGSGDSRPYEARGGLRPAWASDPQVGKTLGTTQERAAQARPAPRGDPERVQRTASPPGLEIKAALAGWTPPHEALVPPGWSVTTGGDAVGDQYNGWLSLHAPDGTQAGYIDYTVADWDPDAQRHEWVGIRYVHVEPAHRRQGLATLLLRMLRVDNPGVPIDPGSLTPEGAAWWNSLPAHLRGPTASKTASLPEGIIFKQVEPIGSNYAEIKAYLGGEHHTNEIGHILWSVGYEAPWDEVNGEIQDVWVSKEHRRKGIATELLRRARKVDPRVRHSDHLTPAGREWAERVGKTANHVERFLGWAMNHWRSSFGDARRIREAADAILAGRVPEPYEGDTTRLLDDDARYPQMALAMLQALANAPRQRWLTRVDRSVPQVGEEVEVSLLAGGVSSEDVAGFEYASDAFGMSEPRHIWWSLLDCPALMYDDGREGITGGRFKVESVAPMMPAPYLRGDAERTLVKLRWVGPSAGMARLPKTASGQDEIEVWHLTDVPGWAYDPEFIPMGARDKAFGQPLLFATTSPQMWSTTPGLRRHERPYAARLRARGTFGEDIRFEHADVQVVILPTAQVEVLEVVSRENARELPTPPVGAGLPKTAMPFGQGTLWPQTAYRGLEVGWVDWEVLDDLLPVDPGHMERWVRQAMGQHWTRDFEVAKAFALGQGLSGGFREPPNDESSFAGVVVEVAVDGADMIEEGDERWEERRLDQFMLRGEGETLLLPGTEVTVTRAWVVLREQDGGVQVHAEVPLNLRRMALKVAMPDAEGWWYHSGRPPMQFEWPGFIHLGTRRAAGDREGDVAADTPGWADVPHNLRGDLYRVRLSPQRPLNTPQTPLTDWEANVLDEWERGYAGERGRGAMPEPDELTHFSGAPTTAYEIAQRTGFQGADMHDAVYYTNDVEDPGSISVMVKSEAMGQVERAPTLAELEAERAGQMALFDPRMVAGRTANQPLTSPDLAVRGSGQVRTLYRGLHLGTMTKVELDEMRANPRSSIEEALHTPAGIHWTSDLNSADNFAIDLDPEGWARELDDDDEGYTVGIVLEAEVGEEHIVRPGTQEWEDYSFADAILDPSHPEAEVTVRTGAPLQIVGAQLLWSGPDGYPVGEVVPLRLQTTASRADLTFTNDGPPIDMRNRGYRWFLAHLPERQNVGGIGYKLVIGSSREWLLREFGFDPDDPENKVVNYEIEVDYDYQRQGIATALWEEFEEWLSQHLDPYRTVIDGGGLSPDGAAWRASNPGYDIFIHRASLQAKTAAVLHEERGPRTYYHGGGREGPRADTGIDEWDRRFFVSHDPEVARLYGPEVREVEVGPQARILVAERAASEAVDIVRRAEAEGYDVVEFYRPHDFIGHVIINEAVVVRGGRQAKTAMYQMAAGVAEMRVRDGGHAGRTMGSEDELVRYLQGVLPGWDVAEVNQRQRETGASDEEVLGAWGRPGLLVQRDPGMARGGGGKDADAMAQVGDIALPGVDTDGMLVFHYGDLAEMDELVLLHEAAHVLDDARFSEGHGQAWARHYIRLAKRHLSSQAANLLQGLMGVQAKTASPSGRVGSVGGGSPSVSSRNGESPSLRTPAWGSFHRDCTPSRDRCTSPGMETVAYDRTYVFGDPEETWRYRANAFQVWVRWPGAVGSALKLSERPWPKQWPPPDMTREVEAALADARTATPPLGGQPEPPYYLVARDGHNGSKVVATVPSLDQPRYEQPQPFQHGYARETAPACWRALSWGSSDDFLRALLNEVMDLGLPEQYHPSLEPEANLVTIYRGISLEDPSADPTTSTHQRGGVGGSWTLDLEAAKGIAEFGQAGFNKGHVHGTGIIEGHVRVLKDYDTDPPIVTGTDVQWPERRAVLRAEVDLNAPGVSLLAGPYSYAPEQEVSLANGTPVRLTGVMEAQFAEAAHGEIERVVSQVRPEDYVLPFGVRVTWPSSFRSVNVQRTASETASVADDPQRWEYRQRRWDKGIPVERTKQVGEYTMHLTPSVDAHGDREIHVLTADGGYVAKMFFGPIDDWIEGAPEVKPEHRRKGIATAMYVWAEEVTGKTIRPAESHTDAAERFWQQPHRPFGHTAGASGDGWVTCSDGVVRWGRYGAAGVLVRTSETPSHYLLQKRGEAADEGGTWGIPGGALDEGESAHAGALREFSEETGQALDGARVVREHVHKPADDWSYTTVVVEVDEPFEVGAVGWESSETAWFTADEMRSLRLHPAFADSLGQVLATTAMADKPGPGTGNVYAGGLTWEYVDLGDMGSANCWGRIDGRNCRGVLRYWYQTPGVIEIDYLQSWTGGGKDFNDAVISYFAERFSGWEVRYKPEPMLLGVGMRVGKVGVVPDVLPVNQPGLWYRLHYRPRRWQHGEEASSAPFRSVDPDFEDITFDDRQRQRGYSAFGDPFELASYLDDMGWTEHLPGFPDKHYVVMFQGRQVGMGANFEPLVEPTGSRSSRVEMTWEEFEEALAKTDWTRSNEPYMRGKQLTLDFAAIKITDANPEGRILTKTASEPTVVLYHGTNDLAAQSIRTEGLRPISMADIATSVEDAYGLPRGSVYNSPWFEYERYRRPGVIHLAGAKSTAEHYAKAGGEAITNALKAVWRIQTDGIEWRGMEWQDHLRDWMDRERDKHPPMVVEVEVPWSWLVEATGWLDTAFTRETFMQHIEDQRDVLVARPIPPHMIRGIRSVGSKTAAGERRRGFVLDLARDGDAFLAALNAGDLARARDLVVTAAQREGGAGRWWAEPEYIGEMYGRGGQLGVTEEGRYVWQSTWSRKRNVGVVLVGEPERGPEAHGTWYSKGTGFDLTDVLVYVYEPPPPGLTEPGARWLSLGGGMRVMAFGERLDWRQAPASGSQEAWEAVHHGVRFRLEGGEAEPYSSNWGTRYRGGWRLDILEPGDRVQIGLPWHHRTPPDAMGYEREGRSHFNELEEAKRYVEDVIIGGGVIDQMIQRDVFPEGSIRYHVTLASLVPSIMSTGLQPRSQAGTGVSVISDLKDVARVLWDLKTEDWAPHAGQPLALLRLDVSGMLRSTIKALTGEERVNEDIPAQRISVLVRDIPWYLTESRFTSYSLSDDEIMRLLQRDPAVTRKAWVGLPGELDQIVAQGLVEGRTKVIDLERDYPWAKPLLHELAKGSGGFTVLDVLGDAPSTGFVVSPYPELERKVPLRDLQSAPDLLGDYYDTHRIYFERSDHWFGAWYDKGFVYLDVVVLTPSQAEAERMAIEARQLAYYDLTTGTTHFISGVTAALRDIPAKYLVTGAPDGMLPDHKAP